jgi:low temperature requirement protein LtrA
MTVATEEEREQRVTVLELFFDLVFVFAFTQVATLLSDDPTWRGLTRGMPVLAALWWAWSAYAWLTNTINPEEGVVRLAMFASMGAMLVAALAVPNAFGSDALAFGSDALAFGVAYLVVRVLHLALYELAARDDRELRVAVTRLVPSATIGPALILAAAALDGPAQGALWALALLIDYGGAILVGTAGWRVATSHFVERYGLVAFRWRTLASLSRGRPVAAAACAALIPLGTEVSAIAALAGVAAICVLLIAYEAIRFRAVRHEIRHAP